MRVHVYYRTCITTNYEFRWRTRQWFRARVNQMHYTDLRPIATTSSTTRTITKMCAEKSVLFKHGVCSHSHRRFHNNKWMLVLGSILFLAGYCLAAPIRRGTFIDDKVVSYLNCVLLFQWFLFIDNLRNTTFRLAWAITLPFKEMSVLFRSRVLLISLLP